MLWSLDETALDLFARRPAKSFRTGLRFVDDAVGATGFQPRHVVEVCGSNAAPKLLVLLHAVAAFLLQSLDDGGSGSGSGNDNGSDTSSGNCMTHSTEDAVATLQRARERVFLFDHECDTDAHELLAIVSAKLRTQIPDPAQRRTAARRVMDRVVVYNCRDTLQCLATLNQLHFELLDAPTTPLLLVLHCVSSFHAIDKMTAKSVGDGLALSEQVFALLRQFSHHHSPVIFATKETSASARSGWESPEFLPSSWSRQVSKRIHLRALPTRQQSSDASVKDETTTLDKPSSVRFQAKCVVRGESCVYSCRVRGCEVVVLDQQSHGQSNKK